MKKGAKQQIQVVIPDAGPLISLARAAALEILLVFKDDVRIVITDYVEFETTRFKDRFPDAQRICNFISANAGRVEIQETLFGKTMKQMYLMRQRFEQDAQFRASMLAINAEPPAVSRDAGELSIVSYAAELIKHCKQWGKFPTLEESGKKFKWLTQPSIPTPQIGRRGKSRLTGSVPLTMRRLSASDQEGRHDPCRGTGSLS